MLCLAVGAPCQALGLKSANTGAAGGHGMAEEPQWETAVGCHGDGDGHPPVPAASLGSAPAEAMQWELRGGRQDPQRRVLELCLRCPPRPPSSPTATGGCHTVQGAFPSFIFCCLFLAARIYLKRKSRLRGEQTEKARSWESSKRELPLAAVSVTPSPLIDTLRALQPRRAVKFRARGAAPGAEHKQSGAPPKLKYLTTFSILSHPSTRSRNGVGALRVSGQPRAGEAPRLQRTAGNGAGRRAGLTPALRSWSRARGTESGNADPALVARSPRWEPTPGVLQGDGTELPPGEGASRCHHPRAPAHDRAANGALTPRVVNRFVAAAARGAARPCGLLELSTAVPSASPGDGRAPG